MFKLYLKARHFCGFALRSEIGEIKMPPKKTFSAQPRNLIAAKYRFWTKPRN